MNHATQVSLCERIYTHLDNQSTDTANAISRIPTSAYTSMKLLTREKESLFEKRPQFVGLSGSLPHAGDYLCDDNYGVPLLLVRDQDMQFRAFLNVCQHRGSRLVDGRGNTGRFFTCPYHGWSYDNAGALKGIPSAQYFAPVDPAKCGLVQLPCAEENGMLWVQPKDQVAINPSAYLNGLSAEIESYGLRDYHLYQSRELKLNLNWKLAIDTFLEPYHFPVLHKNTVGPIFFPNLCLFDSFGPHLREVLPRRSIASMRQEPRDKWDLIKHSALVYVLFPNTVFVMQIDHAEIWRAFPDWNNPDNSTVLLDFYIPHPAETDKARRHWDANLELTVKTVLEEDFPVSAGAQFGFHSNAQSHIILGRNEPALAHFENMISRHIQV